MPAASSPAPRSRSSRSKGWFETGCAVREDIERWDAKYARARPRFDPDPLVVEQAAQLGGGTALDLACGVAANALFLAGCGFEAFAVDGSFEGVRLGMAESRRRGLPLLAFVADLDCYPLPPERFDLVVVIRYLNRGLFPAIRASLRPGGVLVYRTFNVRHLSDSPTFNPDYLLQPGELLERVRGLEVLDTNDGARPRDPATWLVARRRDAT